MAMLNNQRVYIQIIHVLTMAWQSMTIIMSMDSMIGNLTNMDIDCFIEGLPPIIMINLIGGLPHKNIYKCVYIK